LVMMLMCALACCLPLIRRRCSALFPPPAKEVVLPIPAVLLSAASVPADLPAPPSLQQMDMQPGCCAAAFDQKLDKLTELPSYDISKYSVAERELIAHSIEKGTAFFTQPPYNPADESERSCTRGLAALAVRTTSGCSFGLGAVAWLLVVQLDVAYAVVHWVVSLYTCKEDLPGWGGVGAFVGDFWFSVKKPPRAALHRALAAASTAPDKHPRARGQLPHRSTLRFLHGLAHGVPEGGRERR
jgi:hypothetical protein